MSESRCYLDLGIGDRAIIEKAIAEYASAEKFIEVEGPKYGIPHGTKLSELDEVQLETMSSIYSSALPLVAPAPLIAGRLVIALSSNPGLGKTTANFSALCTGERGACKKAPNRKLHYAGCPIHRIQKDFVMQGGDVTRFDGSGGESIYGGTFKDEKPGLQASAAYGSIAMANSGKNSNSSQFFIVLTRDPQKLKKVEGGYVIFGRVVEGLELLERVNGVGSESGEPKEKVWIERCGVF